MDSEALTESNTAEQIAQLQQENLRKAGEAVQAVLDAYSVTITAEPQIENGRIVAVVKLVNVNNG